MRKSCCKIVQKCAGIPRAIVEMSMMNFFERQRTAWLCCLAVSMVAITASAVSAETLLMPPRDFLKGASEVVWGITTQSPVAACTLDYGDATATTNCNGADRSYIAFNHTYANAGTFTVTLTVGAEVATVSVNVFNGPGLTAEALRNLNVNRAIQDGLRYL